MAASGEVDLRGHLQGAYGLGHVEVVADLHRDDLPLASLGAAGSRLLKAEIDRGEAVTIGLGYGRTLAAAADGLGATPAPHVRFASLMGGLGQGSGANPHQVIDRLAERTGAGATTLPVPLVAGTAADREALMAQAGVQEAFAAAAGADLLVVGIGTTEPSASLVTSGMIPAEDMAAIRRQGGVAEMLGHFLDEAGRPVETDLTRRLLTLPLDALRGRRIVALAGGAGKARAIKAALESGLLAGLVTDEHTARAIEDLAHADGRQG